MRGRLVHPFDDDDFISGNDGAALEILEDLPDVDAIVAAMGGCRALWSCRVKIEKTLVAIEPSNGVGAVQFFLTNEAHTPFNWPS